MSALFNLFYIYDPWFFHFFRMSFFCGVVTFLILNWKYFKKELINGIKIPFDSTLIIISLILLSAIPLLLNNTKDFSVTLMYCKTLILFISGVAIYNVFYQKENAQIKLIDDLKIGINIQSVFGLLALLGIPFVIDLLLGTNALIPRFFGSEQEYRLYNVTSSAFFQLSLFYLFLLHFLLAYNDKKNSIRGIYLFLILFIGLISGRTFLFLSVISIVLYFKWRYIPYLLAFGIIILLLAIYFPDNRYVAHSLEPIINIISGTGKISSSTDNLVKNHLFIPEMKQFLFGDGYYYTQDGKYYGATDSGFIRQVLFGGLWYMFTCLLFTLYFIVRVARNWFNGSMKFILSTFFILSVCNIKADTYAFPGIMLVLLMFLSLFGETGKQITLFKQGENNV